MKLRVFTVKVPPILCPPSIPGLVKAVANKKNDNNVPTPVNARIDFSFVHGTKNEKNAMAGFTMAFKVTLRW